MPTKANLQTWRLYLEACTLLKISTRTQTPPRQRCSFHRESRQYAEFSHARSSSWREAPHLCPHFFPQCYDLLRICSSIPQGKHQGPVLRRGTKMNNQIRSNGPMVQWSNTKPGRWELLHIMGTECFMWMCRRKLPICDIHLHTESKTHWFLRISFQNSHQSAIHSWFMCIFIKRQKHPRGKWLDTNPAAPSHAFSTGHSSAISGSLVSMKVSRSWCLEHLPEGVCTFSCQKKWQIQEMFVHACMYVMHYRCMCKNIIGM